MSLTYIQKVLEKDKTSNLLNEDERTFLQRLDLFANEFIDVFHFDAQDYIEHYLHENPHINEDDFDNSTVVVYLTFNPDVGIDDFSKNKKYNLELDARLVNDLFYKNLDNDFGYTILDEGSEIIKIIDGINPIYFNFNASSDDTIVLNSFADGFIRVILDPDDFKDLNNPEVPTNWIDKTLFTKMEEILPHVEHENFIAFTRRNRPQWVKEKTLIL